jgi:hypothetical protein
MVRKTILIFAILLMTLLISCCDLFCNREKFAKVLIEKVESYQIKYGKLPNDISELGIKEKPGEESAYYEKKTDSTFIVWYAIGFESMVYYSDKKVWKEEG